MTPEERESRSTDDERGAALAACAADVDHALIQLAHQLTHSPTATPADVDIVLAHLASGIATLPQIAHRLGDVLDRSRSTWLLSMDDMTATTDPGVAIGTARAHLDAFDGPLHETYRHLNAARNEAAHIRAEVPQEYVKVASNDRPRPEARQPPHHLRAVASRPAPLTYGDRPSIEERP